MDDIFVRVPRTQGVWSGSAEAAGGGGGGGLEVTVPEKSHH